jgi:hypothetical protein
MMPAGEYWCGDLCYVLHDAWDEICSLTIVGHECIEGEFQLKDGRRFAMYSTKFGDGTYKDQKRKEYWVDSGTLGCIRVEDIHEHKDNHGEGGNVYKFSKDFRTGNTDEGIITFGHVSINTGYYGDEDYDE